MKNMMIMRRHTGIVRGEPGNTQIASAHRRVEKCFEQKLRQTRRRTQAGLTPGKDDNDVWHNLCWNRLKGSMGACYRKREVPAIA